jgi:hypothetical protein
VAGLGQTSGWSPFSVVRRTRQRKHISLMLLSDGFCRSSKPAFRRGFSAILAQIHAPTIGLQKRLEII